MEKKKREMIWISMEGFANRIVCPLKKTCLSRKEGNWRVKAGNRIHLIIVIMDKKALKDLRSSHGQ